MHGSKNESMICKAEMKMRVSHSTPVNSPICQVDKAARNSTVTWTRDHRLAGDVRTTARRPLNL